MKYTIQHLFRFVLIFCGLILSVQSGFAQAPSQFNYQGIARDDKGNPLSHQAMQIKLSILPSMEALVPEYEETQRITTNEFGLYTLQIGKGQALRGDMKLVSWDKGNKYIQVAIDPKGGDNFVTMGTTQLLSVPYALYANQAGSATQATSSTRATNNFIEKTNGSGVANSTSLLFDNGTNIGIGTTTPSAKFQITQTVASVQEHIRMQNLSTTGAGRFTLYADGVNNYSTFTKYGSAFPGGYAGVSSMYPFANLLAFGNNGIAANDGKGRFLISTAGNAGISLFKGGTSKLKFHADFSTENVGIGGNAVPTARVHLNNTDGNSMNLRLTNNVSGHGDTDGVAMTIDAANAVSLINKENAILELGTNNTPMMTLDPSGVTSFSGQLKIPAGNPGTGKILTSDASGLATWSQAPSSGVSSVNGDLGVVTQSFTLMDTSLIPSVVGSGTNAVTLNLPKASTSKIGVLDSNDYETFTNKLSGTMLPNRIPKGAGNFNLDLSMMTDNGTSIGVNTTSPNASALLHLNSGNKGILIPQVSIDSLTDVTSIPSPATGLLVYNTVQPGIKNDMARGYYYYSTNSLTWVRLADNLNDNRWQKGGTLGVKLRDTVDGVEMMDNFTGSALNWLPKVKILKLLDSTSLNSKNNINALVISGVNRKPNAGWEFRQKTSILLENSYQTTGNTTGTNTVAISAYTENPGTTTNNNFNGLAFYTFATPNNTAAADTPSLAMLRHNVAIGAYAVDDNTVTQGRLQITGFSNGDQLSLRHPSNAVLKWGFYVSSIDSSLNFYANGNLRANIDRVTGVYSALSDRNYKKDIVALAPVLEKIKRLKAYNYRYLDSQESDRKVNGFMAQDLLGEFPELVYQRYDRTTDKPLYTVDYSGFGVLAVKAIQEQQVIIEQQQNEIEVLKQQQADILQRLSALEKK